MPPFDDVVDDVKALPIEEQERVAESRACLMQLRENAIAVLL
jgi:hypothetical protein